MLGCLTQADLADQRFSPLCATNVPHELSGFLSLLGPRRLVRSEASSMADGARIDGGSGIWKLTSRAPRTASTFGCCRTTVAMATPRSSLQGGLRTRPLGTSSGELTDPPWRPGPGVSRCRSRSSRGTHSLLDSAVRECGESRVAPVQRASFRHYGRPTSPTMTRAVRAPRRRRFLLPAVESTAANSSMASDVFRLY